MGNKNSMSSRFVLGLDADGVLLNYLVGLFEYARSTGRRVACEPNQVSDWSCSNAFPDLSEKEIYSLIEEFSVTDGFGRLPAMEGAVEAIHGIKQALPDVSLVAITSAGSSQATIDMRHRNLEMFPLDDVHVLPLGASKKEHLSRLPKGSVFVDDLHKHVETAEQVGLQGVLFRHSYNSMHQHRHVISGWDEGRDLVARLLSGTDMKVHAPA